LSSLNLILTIDILTWIIHALAKFDLGSS
jgi:hypothetical protein